MPPSKPTYISLSEYWQGIATALDVRLKASKEYLQHPTVGFSAEAYFRDLLRQYLPTRYAVESGFVMDASGARSGHIDVIIADTFHIPPLCSEPNYKVFAAESVCAVIEITTGPMGRIKKTPKLEVDVDTLAQVRRIAETRKYSEIQPVQKNGKIEYLPIQFTVKGSPRCFLITSGDEWKSAKTYEQNLIEALRRSKAKGNPSWINGALSMQHGLLRFTPFKEYETEWVSENSLLSFLFFVNQAVSEFPTFKIDIQRYVKYLPSIKNPSAI